MGKKFLNGDVFIYKSGGKWYHSECFLKNNTKEGKTICLDFDGVIVDPAEYKSRLLKQAGYSVEPENSSRQKCLNLGVPFPVYRKISSQVAVQYLMDLPIEKGAFEAIQQLGGDNDIYIVTSRNAEETEAVIDFVKYHNITVDGIVSVDDRSKLNSLASILPHIFIDDSLSKLQDLIDKANQHIVKKLENCRLFLYENITNKNDLVYNTPIKKVKSWKDIVDIVDSGFVF